MSAVTRQCLSVALVLVGSSLLADALSCMPCYSKEGRYQGPSCDRLPEDDWCERAFRPCGCCPECAGMLGDVCHGMNVKCRQGLWCVNADNVGQDEVGWWQHNFVGRCKHKPRPHSL